MLKKLAIQIIDENPIAADILRQWYLEKMKKSFVDDSVPEDFKNMMLKKGIPDQTLAILLDESPRSFFDVFDENKMFIEIRISEYAEGGFYYIINKVEDNLIYESRIPCERAAVERAIEMIR